MMHPATRNRLIIGLAIAIAGGFIAYQMFFSLTPPRHADHDHAIAKLDAGGFLWLESFEGDRRNFVGKPEKVLVLHWFDPMAADSTEEVQAARFATKVAGDPMVEVIFVAQATSWEGFENLAQTIGVQPNQLYLDEDAQTGDLFGVRRLPETLIYDPKGFLAFQAKGPMDWNNPALDAQIQKAKGGVEEIH